MKHIYLKKQLFTALTIVLGTASCVDGAYDLNNISLKMTLGPNGITLPLGETENITVDSLIRGGGIDDSKLVVDDGFYAYRIDSTLNESIDPIKIDPIRDVIPEIDPYIFRFADGSGLPENVQVSGFSDQVSVAVPAIDFGKETLSGVSVNKDINIDRYIGISIPAGTEIPLPNFDETEQFAFTLNDIPDEIAAIKALYFEGADQGRGTPLKVRFTLGALASSVSDGHLTMRVALPASYTLRMTNNYGGTASVNGSTLTVTNFPVTGNSAEFEFYLSQRIVTEQISILRKLQIHDQLSYTLDYTGISNGTKVQAGSAPSLTLEVHPVVDDALITTDDIAPDPESNTTDLAFEVNDLEHISHVNYIAFSSANNNAIHLSANQANIPLNGQIGVRITFPDILEFAPGIAGMSQQVLTTTLDALGSGLRLPLRGIRLEGDDATVVNNTLSVNKPITTLVTPIFPSQDYTLSELRTDAPATIDLRIDDMNFELDLSNSNITAGFSEPMEITQTIDEQFEVPNEVGAISFATVLDADTGGTATVTINLGVENSPVDYFYIDNAVITLPTFLKASHPNLDPKTNTIRLPRIEYTGQSVSIARITLEGIREVPITTTSAGKRAQLRGDISIKATVNVPDGSEIEGLNQAEITLRPLVTASPLRIEKVTGSVDVDLQKYLQPVEIDLGDISKSLGEEDIEINLVAPQISLNISNPIGASMKGNITLLPYDFSDTALDPVVIRNITIEPAGEQAAVTKLFITDMNAAPEGYTLCRVEDLAKIVRIIPSKLVVTFDLAIDRDREQTIVITGEEYPFMVDYEISLPLRFKQGAEINYTGSSNVEDTFKDITDYDISAEDVLIRIDTRTTLPLALQASVEVLGEKDLPVEGITAQVIGNIAGYNALTDGEYKESPLQVQLLLDNGNIKLLTGIKKIRYKLNGQSVGEEAGLSPDQYIWAKMKLVLKKGITFDVDTL